MKNIEVIQMVLKIFVQTKGTEQRCLAGWAIMPLIALLKERNDKIRWYAALASRPRT
ncbi:MAG: hypothetical protein GY862_11575 [Gammaproteobacteria bacterium]|nr:hypothetical protein [Gammaproteobacteria bacterium]